MGGHSAGNRFPFEPWKHERSISANCERWWRLDAGRQFFYEHAGGRQVIPWALIWATFLGLYQTISLVLHFEKPSSINTHITWGFDTFLISSTSAPPLALPYRLPVSSPPTHQIPTLRHRWPEAPAVAGCTNEHGLIGRMNPRNHRRNPPLSGASTRSLSSRNNHSSMFVFVFLFECSI